MQLVVWRRQSAYSFSERKHLKAPFLYFHCKPADRRLLIKTLGCSSKRNPASLDATTMPKDPWTNDCISLHNLIYVVCCKIVISQ